MNVVSLFSGIGGLDLGVRLAIPSARVVAYVERDAFCQRIIRARITDGLLDDAPIFDDVRTFPPADWTERVDLVCGGWPCQPFSLAGKRQGRSDERHLWPEVARIVGLCRPRYVFGENVPGFISLGLGECLADLAALGFDAEWTTVRASDVGAPHRRERIFILAYASSTGYGTLGRVQPQSDCGWTPSGPIDSSWPVGHPDFGRHGRTPEEVRAGRAGAQLSGQLVADADDTRLQGWASAGRRSDECAARPSSAPLFPPGPADTEGWRAVLERWPDLAPAVEAPPKSTFRRVADATAARVDRLKALGNAVVPLQAAAALRILVGRIGE